MITFERLIDGAIGFTLFSAAALAPAAVALYYWNRERQGLDKPASPKPVTPYRAAKRAVEALMLLAYEGAFGGLALASMGIEPLMPGTTWKLWAFSMAALVGLMGLLSAFFSSDD